MSDPQDWVTTGVTATTAPDVARRAAVFVAGAAIRLGWDKETLSDLLDSLGLLRPAGNEALNDGGRGCPSQMARQRHIREGNECRKCWPGGRQTVGTQRDSA